MDMPAWMGNVPEIIMAAGTLLLFWQIFQGRQQARTTFEDSLDKEYRDIIHKLPSKAVLGGPLDDAKFEEHLDEFFAYFDLCNQQAFLRQRDRISDDTWAYWSDGMRANLKKRAFRTAWEHVKQHATGEFNELRTLEASDFRADPAKAGHSL
jgi:hypothetical protein